MKALSARIREDLAAHPESRTRDIAARLKAPRASVSCLLSRGIEGVMWRTATRDEQPNGPLGKIYSYEPLPIGGDRWQQHSLNPKSQPTYGPTLSESMADRMRKHADGMRGQAERLEGEAEGLRNRLRSVTDEARALRLAADLIVQEALELSVPF